MTAIWIVAGVFWLCILPALTRTILARLNMARPNYRGEVIPIGFGLLILFWSTPALALMSATRPTHRTEYLAMLTLCIGFGALGFVDDRWGDRSVGGLRGHVQKALIERQLTTGFVKLVGGALAAFVVPYCLLGHPWMKSLVEGALIALSANTFNLLDLRPGRSGAIFLACAAPVTVAAWQDAGSPPPLLFVIVPAAVVDVLDALGSVMLGDTGSNLLGAALGGSLVLLGPPTPVLFAVVALLLVLHVVAERWSLSRIIEATPFLRRLDRLTGRRS